MAVAEQEDVWLAELEVVGATQGQAEACIGQTAKLSYVGEKHHLFVVVQMLLLFDPSAPSPSDQSNFVSVAPQTAGNTAAHLPAYTQGQAAHQRYILNNNIPNFVQIETSQFFLDVKKAQNPDKEHLALNHNNKPDWG